MSDKLYVYQGTCFSCNTPYSCKNGNFCCYPPEQQLSQVSRWDEDYAEALAKEDLSREKRE